MWYKNKVSLMAFIKNNDQMNPVKGVSLEPHDTLFSKLVIKLRV